MKNTPTFQRVTCRG